MEKQPKPLRTFTTRREFLRAGLVVPGSLVLAACVATPPTSPASQAEPATAPVAEEIAPEATPTPVPETGEAAQALAPTPACPDDDEATPAQTEGPFYTPDTPQRTSLREPGIPGTPMVLTGYVLGTNCQPVAGALLDFWHADDAGVYDNDGYRLRE